MNEYKNNKKIIEKNTRNSKKIYLKRRQQISSDAPKTRRIGLSKKKIALEGSDGNENQRSGG